jgi:hypothetical protein
MIQAMQPCFCKGRAIRTLLPMMGRTWPRYCEISRSGVVPKTAKVQANFR